MGIRRMNNRVFPLMYSQFSKFFTDQVRSTREGNVFTRVCDSVHREGGVSPSWTMNC